MLDGFEFLRASKRRVHWFFLLCFFAVGSAHGYYYEAGSLADSARRSRSLLETYSDYVSSRFNTPVYYAYTRPDFAEKNDLGIYPALNLPFSEVKEDYFYYYSRARFHNWVEAYLGKSIFVSDTHHLLIDQYEARAALKTDPLFKTPAGDFGAGFHFFWEGYDFGQIIKSAKNPLINYNFYFSDFDKERMIQFLSVNDFVVSATAYLYPHLYISYGVVINYNTIYSSSELTLRHFIDSNFLGVFFLQGDYSAETGKAHNITQKTEVFNLISLFSDYKRTVFPDLYLGYTYLKPAAKSLDASKDKEQTLFADFFYNYLKAFTLSGRLEFYLNQKSQLLKGYQLKEFYLEGGFNHNILALFFKETPEEYYHSWDSGTFFYYLVYGISRFTDERLLDFGSPKAHVWGYNFGIRSHLFKWYQLDLFYQKNYSRSLRNLAESYNFSQYTVKFSMYF